MSLPSLSQCSLYELLIEFQEDATTNGLNTANNYQVIFSNCIKIALDQTSRAHLVMQCQKVRVHAPLVAPKVFTKI